MEDDSSNNGMKAQKSLIGICCRVAIKGMKGTGQEAGKLALYSDTEITLK